MGGVIVAHTVPARVFFRCFTVHKVPLKLTTETWCAARLTHYHGSSGSNLNWRNAPLQRSGFWFRVHVGGNQFNMAFHWSCKEFTLIIISWILLSSSHIIIHYYYAYISTNCKPTSCLKFDFIRGQNMNIVLATDVVPQRSSITSSVLRPSPHWGSCACPCYMYNLWYVRWEGCVIKSGIYSLQPNDAIRRHGLPYKPIRIYMGGLILGVNTLYRLFCFFKLFPISGKELTLYQP